MTKKYLIKEVSFPYDNYYFTDRPTLGTVLHTYDDKSEAEAKLSELMIKEFKFIVAEQCYNYDIFEGFGDEDRINNVQSFYDKKTVNQPRKDSFPTPLYGAFELDLTDEEIVELMTISGISTYHLIETDSENSNYMLWINRKNDYFHIYVDEPALFDCPSLDTGDDDLMHSIYDELNDYAPQGKLSDLSKDPESLQKYMNDSSELFYYDKSESKIQSDFPAPIMSGGEVPSMWELEEINELLNEPWFEIREASET